MNHDLSLTTSVEINVSPARVWEVLTKPELIKIYLYGTECITDWKVGSEVIFQGAYEGQTYKDHGVILENQDQKLIRYSYWTGFSGLPDKPENYGEVTYKIEDLGNGRTHFSWIQKGYPDEARLDHSKESMPAFLDHLKQVAEEE